MEKLTFEPKSYIKRHPGVKLLDFLRVLYFCDPCIKDAASRYSDILWCLLQCSGLVGGHPTAKAWQCRL